MNSNAYNPRYVIQIVTELEYCVGLQSCSPKLKYDGQSGYLESIIFQE